MGFVQNLKQYFLNSNKKRVEIKGTDRFILLPSNITSNTPIDYNTIDDLVDYVKKSIPSPGPGGGGLITVTYSQLQSAITGGTVTPDSLYKITDRGDLGLYFMGLSNTTLDFENGTMDMLVPFTYQTGNFNGYDWLGIWNSGLTPSIGNLVIWGGHVWRNLSGNLGAPVDDFTLDSEWTLVPKSIGAYKVKTLGCSYDFANDWINKGWDNRGNILGCSYDFTQNVFWVSVNPINHCDWGDDTRTIENNMSVYLVNNLGWGTYSNIVTSGSISGNSGPVYDNIVGGKGIYNNKSTVTGNNVPLEISNNLGNIFYNSNRGDISNNTGHAVQHNSNHGGIGNNTAVVEYNSNRGGIGNNQVPIIGNRNNGIIFGIVAPATDVSNNTNNGDITTSTAGSISDPIVNK